MIHTAVLITVIFLPFFGRGLWLSFGNISILALVSNKFNTPFQFLTSFQDNLKYLAAYFVDLIHLSFAAKNIFRGDLFFTAF